MPKGKVNYDKVRRQTKKVGGRTLLFDSGWEVRLCELLEELKQAGAISQYVRNPFGLTRRGSKKSDYFTFYQFGKEKRNKVRGYRPDFLVWVVEVERVNKVLGLVEGKDTLLKKGFNVLEPKGKMDVRSRFKLLKMAKYYPLVNVVVLREAHFEVLGK